jgi:two-component sensor histidine kinase
LNRIKPQIAVGDIMMDIDNGIPCGLIINELVSNSMKHAFNDEDSSKGVIQVDLQRSPKKSNEITLLVADNGCGFPKDIDFRNTKTFGLQLVNALVEQLGGNIKLLSNNGTQFRITFEIKESVKNDNDNNDNKMKKNDKKEE